MAIPKTSRIKPKSRSPIFLLTAAISAIALLYFLSSLISTTGSDALQTPISSNRNSLRRTDSEKFLYWGNRIDCPGKHCESCEGLGHQESSLRCALEEAIFLRRTFVMPSRMCINPIHNNKGILHHSDNVSSEERWAASSCAMDSLYDLDLISNTIPVILDNSKTWFQVMSTSMKLGSRGVALVEGVSRADLKETSQYSKILLINRTANHLSWFMECKDRNNRTAVLLPHSYLPSMAAKKLRDAAEKIMALLGDYDAIHVRRGDILKTRKDRFGVPRTLHPHLDRDTQPRFILCRIVKWVPPGRMLFIASNERTPNFFSPLSVRYKLAYSSNYSRILDPVVENNYQLFMIERLILGGAKTYIKTYKEIDTDRSLTDDPKKNTKIWQEPVYTKQGC
ncbi:uncharacterized protein LOC112519992 [Cynara cardunculus var. scolymus]|uniref:O-fucosyltransferase family protein n=1 Tax=Cynara cardunculus var. scolymus TaxID=59895 RepID=A0A118K4Z6_CYNCS|nr:uncharacterized protein LOC112519992 [Cynara cardunculus var. scolymus]KVI08295.1 hypothetical protein Ccrd_013339 [Cynara cardunculus var. scolymus]